ncbi:Anaphase-promoting complex, cyclosome, subunit 3 [Novipirellula aureliae]|uniref:Anaphase-promoting complex, cyclosome, subunit 3 n=1 Tax=Novipirellula aureliae TaxID=2527966 RepID=A0A5C6E108_9BACT|nr:tetratricopeptide repeat protein [Novipirellula aureliae]TWU43383.1 Anaphase-promoting complex, cyclosome, subunit 3 [Novipirellula aureliae]
MTSGNPLGKPTSPQPPSGQPAGQKPAGQKVWRQRRQELEHRIRSCPTDVELYRELAEIYRKDQRPQESARVLNEAIRMFPDNESLLWDLEEAKLARSLQQYREVADLASKLQTNEVERELKRSKNDWAYRRIEVCKARLDRDPSLTQLHFVLAEALYDCGQCDDALEQLEPLVGLDEYSPQAFLLKGKCLLELGREGEAMSALRASALRRSVPAPLPIRVAGLRLLCETAERLHVDLTLKHYRNQLATSEQELVQSVADNKGASKS